ncbi:MAG: histidine kinase dimerization/phospho-acceptor domain-containing protein, partial [Desulfuromonadales bacterium]|nr:histidine kinase dimerization/phospho-acceptor domain-containing protein [Desulfuromonadales bacterium]
MVKSPMKSLFRSRYTPLIMIITIQIVWVGLVASWIIWFVRNQRRLGKLAQKYGPVVLPSGADWFILVEGLFLLALLLVSVYVIHHLWRRQVALNQAQKDFVAQVTHELKSPLASLRLHLETIRLRRPPAEKLEIFIDTMLSDTERLGGLIDNLLATNRLEQRDSR